MVFADLFFIYFFMPLCILLYFIARSIKARNIVLLAFSIVFYAWGEPVWEILLLAYSLLNFMTGLTIGMTKRKSTKKAALLMALIVDIGVLGVFKYSGFIVENINALLNISIPLPNIRLPIGISFYTFQTLSYSIDCYWGKVKVQKSFPKFLLYVSMFPQLVAGPIVRYSTIAQEIDSRRTTLKDISDGFTRIIMGIGKKVIIANSLNNVVTGCFGTAEKGFAGVSSVSVLGAWAGGAMVAVWYYFDFSGYSDLAIGMGRIFGFHFDENFRYPFVCRSITEFWQRWHISLGSWFRDYVYIPLGGNRCSRLKHLRNISVVWLLTGLWHGASWNFVFWGALNGFFLILEKLFLLKWIKKVPPAVGIIYSKIVVGFGFGIFYFDEGGALVKYFKALVGANGNSFSSGITRNLFLSNIFLILAAAVLSTPIIPWLRSKAEKEQGSWYLYRSAGIAMNIVILTVSSLLLLNSTNNPFLYFRF